MRYISHRGNLDRRIVELENVPYHIDQVLSIGFECEIDVWHQFGEWFLGHDVPTHKVNLSWLTRPGLWCHAKNLEALVKLAGAGIHCFAINLDPFVLTSQNWMWVGPEYDSPLTKRCVIVRPELSQRSMDSIVQAGAICSDNISFYKDYIGDKASNFGC